MIHRATGPCRRRRRVRGPVLRRVVDCGTLRGRVVRLRPRRRGRRNRRGRDGVDTAGHGPESWLRRSRDRACAQLEMLRWVGELRRAHAHGCPRAVGASRFLLVPLQRVRGRDEDQGCCAGVAGGRRGGVPGPAGCCGPAGRAAGLPDAVRPPNRVQGIDVNGVVPLDERVRRDVVVRDEVRLDDPVVAAVGAPPHDGAFFEHEEVEGAGVRDVQDGVVDDLRLEAAPVVDGAELGELDALRDARARHVADAGRVAQDRLAVRARDAAAAGELGGVAEGDHAADGGDDEQARVQLEELAQVAEAALVHAVPIEGRGDAVDVRAGAVDGQQELHDALERVVAGRDRRGRPVGRRRRDGHGRRRGQDRRRVLPQRTHAFVFVVVVVRFVVVIDGAPVPAVRAARPTFALVRAAIGVEIAAMIGFRTARISHHPRLRLADLQRAVVARRRVVRVCRKGGRRRAPDVTSHRAARTRLPSAAPSARRTVAGRGGGLAAARVHEGRGRDARSHVRRLRRPASTTEAVVVVVVVRSMGHRVERRPRRQSGRWLCDRRGLPVCCGASAHPLTSGRRVGGWCG
mmetsp:Transcript_10149/g.31278  ORF Transcript_10149/g.31278 Transcript_10149/m.31278 type:complete len:574 (-) Transcript_10149:181-1902(-)